MTCGCSKLKEVGLESTFVLRTVQMLLDLACGSRNRFGQENWRQNSVGSGSEPGQMFHMVMSEYGTQKHWKT